MKHKTLANALPDQRSAKNIDIDGFSKGLIYKLIEKYKPKGTNTNIDIILNNLDQSSRV